MSFDSDELTDTQKRLIGRLAYWRTAEPDYEQYDDEDVVRGPDGTIPDVVEQHGRFNMYRIDSSIAPKEKTEDHINMSKAKSKKEIGSRTMESLLRKDVFETFEPDYRAYSRAFILTEEALDYARTVRDEHSVAWLLDSD